MSLLDDLSRRFPALLMARRNLSRNQLRSGLAVLGIIIGVFAIASLGMFGTTLRAGATDQLGDIGNEVVVSPAFSEGVTELTERDVTQIERAASGTTVVPVKQRQALVTRGDERTVATLYGMERPGALYTATDGRVPDRLRQGAVVGSGVAERFGLQAGNSITVDEQTYRIVAVLTQQDGISLVDPNNAVIVSPTDFEADGYSQVVVTAETGEAATAAADEIRDTLNGREERVTVFELSSITEGINAFFGILNAFLIGIGSISLLVAGVSILNVMLMSTVERREEIGVLRAVGVQKRDVIRMILLEAALLGFAGGVVGAVLALGAGIALNQFVIDDALATFQPVNLLYLVLAVGFGLITSVLSGLYPAWKAAGERPVDALRK
ncbi:putative ABC transport system permease protein [Halogranum rubrum]|uniref:ABC transporter involved in lipoprotein release, permease component n=2 Tax=Halogranum rubrum TaxID=553466 RepID=J3A468_9EURY|nr:MULTISPECIES: ABC transporter permease [Halogranum]EJN60208.1 ABC transporter involved in lipoprotein release, permease component [Halogranum salarium B-1]SFL09331.1 putative ABC transport system permease protein [Halogranum rubrum]